MSDAREAEAQGRIAPYRLTGTYDGSERTFALFFGENYIGAADDNHIVIAERGVSRFHAVLSVESQQVRLFDRDSKNGCFRNGEPLRSGAIATGDELDFGPVRLRLVEAEDDSPIAFSFPRRRLGSAESGAATEVETQSRSSPVEAIAESLSLLDQLAQDLLSEKETALPRYLGRLAKRLDAAGAVILRWRWGLPPLVHAAWGRETEEIGRQVQSLAAMFRTKLADGESRTGWMTDPSPVSYCLLRAGGEHWCLFVWGLGARPESVRPLLRTILSVVVLVTAAAPDRPRVTATPRNELTLPEGHIVGTSDAMSAVYEEIRTASRADAPVLLLGETGVGKEHFAQIVHYSSKRAGGPFIAINCAALPSELLESELFGIRKGVATGVSERPGRFEQASGGSFFLDEIGDMPLPLQAKLLRVLEQAEIQPVGGPPRAVDVRIIAATNAEPEDLLDRSRFREDLYYRLAGHVIKIPSLRHRRDDVPLLIKHLVEKFSGELEKNVAGITLSAMVALARYPWPGNVRELSHEIRRLVLRCHPSEVIDLPLISEPVLAASARAGEGRIPESNLNLADHVQAVERRVIRRALDRAKGNRSEAVRLLGISRHGLTLKMKRLGMDD